MEYWKKDQGLAASDLIEFVADVQAEVTDAIGIHLVGDSKKEIYPDNLTGGAGPNYALGMHTRRCKRTSLYTEDGVIKVFQIAEGPGPNGEFDPDGDDFPEKACVENMLDLISKL